MQTHKVTISISGPLYDFVDNYQSQHNIKSRSEVIAAALQLLQQKQLESCYQQANEELADDFDVTAGDGLEDETW